jgi:hypothetical protein
VSDGPDLPPGAFVVDPVFGCAVVVPVRTLRKVARDHRHSYAPRRREILDVVGAPDATMDGNRPGRHCFAREDIGPSRWLFVVVDYDERGLGTVISAFPRRRLPRS